VQWASREAYEAMARDPAAKARQAEVSLIASLEPTLYTVTSVHTRGAG
jgi:hypothetical protein